MPRARKKAAPAPEAAISDAPTAVTAVAEDTSFNPAEFDPAMQQQTAATHIPADTERQAAHETGHAAAVGKRPQIIQSGLTFFRNDLLAGVKQGEGLIHGHTEHRPAPSPHEPRSGTEWEPLPTVYDGKGRRASPRNFPSYARWPWARRRARPPGTP